MTLQNDFETLIGEPEDNLQAMGVSDAEFDVTTGIRGLVAQILNIEPSVGGIDVVTSLSCSTDKEAYDIGETVTVTGVLEADKDDTSISNVDLEGYLKGATIKVYEDETLLGTCITNSDGEYTYTYTVENVGDLSISSVFEGTDDYESTNSNNVNITTRSLTLTTSKNILSYVDSESTVLTATLVDTIPIGQTIQLYDQYDELVGTMIDEEDGTYTYTYHACNDGDVEFYAKKGSLESNTVSIEDIWDCDSMTSDTGKWNIDQTKPVSSFTFSESGATIVGTSRGGFINYQEELPSNFEIEITYDFKSSSEPLGRVNNWSIFRGTYQSVNRFIIHYNWAPEYYINHGSLSDGKYFIRYINGFVSILDSNGDMIGGYNIGTSQSNIFQLVALQNITTTIKDFKVRELD